MYSGPVRIVERDEGTNVMELCKKLHAENGMFSLNEGKVDAVLNRAFDKQGGLIGGVGPKHDLHGIVYLNLSTCWYSDDPIWEELFLYVTPEHRKSRNAIELIQFSKWCSDQAGFPLLIGIFSNILTARKELLYERQLHTNSKGKIFLYQKAA